MQRPGATSERLRVHLALAAVTLLFSSNYIIGKIGLRSFHPFAFVWLRVAASTLLLVALARGGNHRLALSRSDRKRALIASLLGVGINQTMFIAGLALTTAHEAAILITTIPIFTLLAAFGLRTEKPTLLKIAGIGIAATGALLIVAHSPAQHGGNNPLLGDFFILINSASYGFYLVVSKPLFQRHSPLALIAFLFVIGTITILPVAVHDLWRTDWSAIPTQAWLALLGVILGPTVAAYALNAWALARAEASMVAAYNYLQPFVASLLAALFLQESLEARVFFAAALIITGVFLSTLRRPSAAVLE